MVRIPGVVITIVQLVAVAAAVHESTPSVTVTVPAGVPKVPSRSKTIVTGSPTVDGLGQMSVMVSVVGARLMTSVPLPVAPVKFGSLLVNVATTAYVPTLTGGAALPLYVNANVPPTGTDDASRATAVA